MVADEQPARSESMVHGHQPTDHGRGIAPHLRWLLGSEPPELPDQEHLWWAAGRRLDAEVV